MDRPTIRIVRDEEPEVDQPVERENEVEESIDRKDSVLQPSESSKPTHRAQRDPAKCPQRPAVPNFSRPFIRRSQNDVVDEERPTDDWQSSILSEEQARSTLAQESHHPTAANHGSLPAPPTLEGDHRQNEVQSRPQAESTKPASYRPQDVVSNNRHDSGHHQLIRPRPSTRQISPTRSRALAYMNLSDAQPWPSIEDTIYDERSAMKHIARIRAIEARRAAIDSDEHLNHRRSEKKRRKVLQKKTKKQATPDWPSIKRKLAEGLLASVACGGKCWRWWKPPPPDPPSRHSSVRTHEDIEAMIENEFRDWPLPTPASASSGVGSSYTYEDIDWDAPGLRFPDPEEEAIPYFVRGAGLERPALRRRSSNMGSGRGLRGPYNRLSTIVEEDCNPPENEDGWEDVEDDAPPRESTSGDSNDTYHTNDSDDTFQTGNDSRESVDSSSDEPLPSVHEQNATPSSYASSDRPENSHPYSSESLPRPPPIHPEHLTPPSPRRSVHFDEPAVTQWQSFCEDVRRLRWEIRGYRLRYQPVESDLRTLWENEKARGQLGLMKRKGIVRRMRQRRVGGLRKDAPRDVEEQARADDSERFRLITTFDSEEAVVQEARAVEIQRIQLSEEQKEALRRLRNEQDAEWMSGISTDVFAESAVNIKRDSLEPYDKGIPACPARTPPPPPPTSAEVREVQTWSIKKALGVGIPGSWPEAEE